jgi:hypothetical protein
MAEELLGMWVVYDHPTDFPNEFVARRHVVNAKGSRPTEEVLTSTALDLLRSELVERGLTMIPRFADDDPKIIEVWL